ncbi:polysaccharide export protein [Erythrobacteraceae bacterium E2-1 Yellow Sea]|nr:polysaccharide export protein [Erythrobacteraceae bacterium E2-1 Yellow Sea]
MTRFRIIALFALTLAGIFGPQGAAAQQTGFGLPIYGFENPAPAESVQPTAETAPPSTAPVVAVTQPQAEDYEKNTNSDVFGAQLFTGAFARQSASTFNDDYAVNVGDTVDIRLWGAYNFQAPLTVDPQGNVFLPNVGPVMLRGVKNKNLQARVEQAVYSVFRSNVFVYANLAEAQPVRIFVGGFVNRPGAYGGTSLDSALHYLDQAGGIDTERGSFIDIEIKRGTATRARINLYDFLLSGEMPQIQLRDGDVIFVNQRQNTLSVRGLAENPRTFEFAPDDISLTQIVNYAKPTPDATHVRVTRSAGTVRNVEYYALGDAHTITLNNGDLIAFTADKRPGTITVRVEGEHESNQEFVLPYGSRLGDVLSQISYSTRSAPENIQLFRVSVKERQKETLDTSLRQLERTALTARSGTAEEAQLRKNEADMLLRFVDRARKIEPLGQVVIANGLARDDLLLENGDILKVPAQDRLVLVSGGVLFPQASIYNPSYRVSDYIDQAGGYAGKKGGTRVIIAHPDGTFDQAEGNSRSQVNAGDEIMVLPEIQSKNRQIFKEVTQILYQIAVSAGVVLGL